MINTVKGKVLPRMNSHKPAITMAIPPKKYHGPQIAASEFALDP